MTTPPADKMVFRELTGPYRTVIELADRALPKVGQYEAGIEQRVVQTRYPGNPVATMQTLGSQTPDSTLSGEWSDRFLGNTAFPIATVNGVQVLTAIELAEAFEGLVVRGQAVEMTWGPQYRLGVLSRFTPRYKRADWLEWEIEAKWSTAVEPASPGASTGVAVPQVLDPPAVADLTTQEGSAFIAAAVDYNSWDVPEPTAPAYAQALESMRAAQNALYGAAVKVADGIAQVQAVPTQLADGIIGTLEAARVAAASVGAVQNSLAEVRDLPAQVWYRAAKLNAQLGESVSTGFSIVFQGRTTSAAAARARAALIPTSRNLQQQANQTTLLALYTARAGDDLRQVSEQYYGNPFAWRALMVFNQLTTSVLAAGQVVRVPQDIEQVAT